MLSSLIALAAFVPAQDPPSDPRAKLLPELREVTATAPATTRFRVYAVLTDRLGLEDVPDKALNAPPAQRSRAVAQLLREHAAPRQAALLASLAELENAGEVDRVRPLWITNTVIFEGTASAIGRVASLPEVERIGWDPPRPTSEYQDVGPPANTIYYTQDFEAGTLPPEFTTSTTNCGFVEVTNLYSPYEGSFHLVMASDTDSCDSTASATLTVDLTGVTTASLRYRFKSMSDEFDPGEDILEASDDGGATWVAVADLNGSTSYLAKTHDLDATGLTYGPNFMLRWSWADNFAPETDGFGIDLIEIADTFPPPPPPGPEPNLVQLQAPALWDLGVDGAGSVILNIDSGTDYTHPDLVNRIWSNPLDPIDGVDNDGNGYIDDHVGWDFESDDNDPYPTSSHGTSTAGIMVGDGSSGIYLTGMAPGAQLAIAKISGETDHWLALQWGISVGVTCSSSSYSYKWSFSPKPDYHMHRAVQDMMLAAGIPHANSIGNQGGSTSHPIPFNISAPGLSPAPWRHPEQTQLDGGVSGVLACGGIELDDGPYSPSGTGPSAWEDVKLYDSSYPHTQDPANWDYPYGGFGGGLQALIKPDLCTYTNVISTTIGGSYTTFGGTSAATPHLGGTLALLTAANPSAQPRHIAEALQITAEDLGAPGKDNLYGAGKVQVRDAALRLFHLVIADDRTPSLGSTLTLNVTGFPGDPFTIWWTEGPAPGTIGYVPIEPRVLTTGVLDGNGMASVAVPITTDAAMVGAKISFRSISDNTAGVTGQVLRSLGEVVVIVP